MILFEHFLSQGKVIESNKANLPEGVLCRATYQICTIGEKNRNNRVYEKAVWDRVLGDQEIQDKLKNRSLFFHAEHPTTTQSNTEKVAGIVTDLQINEGNKVCAVMEVLDTPYGRIVDTILSAKCGLGVSTRADGELEEVVEGEDKYSRVVPESYRFVTIDFTADPSTYGSEIPLKVERELAGVIKQGLDNEKIDRDYATVLLEKFVFHAPEAAAILESIKHDKHHKGCECKTTEKKCTRGCPNAIKEQIEDIFRKDEKMTSSSDTSGQPANAAAADVVAKKSAAHVDKQEKSLKVKESVEVGDEVTFDDGMTRGEGTVTEISSQTGEIKVSNEETGIDRFFSPDCVSVKTRKTNKIVHTVEESGQKDWKCIECGYAFNKSVPASGEVTCPKCKSTDIDIDEKKVKEDVQMKIEIDPKVEQFLLDNWHLFTDEKDAIDNLIKVFKIGEDDAKSYVEEVSKGRGTISAVYAMSNERKYSSGTPKELSERLAFVTAEKKSLAESYAKDIIDSTMKINELKSDLESKIRLLGDTARELSEKKINLALTEANVVTYKSKIEELNEKIDWNVVVEIVDEFEAWCDRDKEEKTVDNLIHFIDKMYSTQSQTVKNAAIRELEKKISILQQYESKFKKLNEAHTTELIKTYVSARLNSMGLRVGKNTLTLLESCKTQPEVDLSIKQVQDALREGLVQSAVPDKITVNKPVDPVINSIDRKITTALEHFGA